MERDFQEIDPRKLDDNVFELIADQWMLVTAGETDGYNTMTASWGAMGELWSRKICVAFVRPQRYTYGFMNRMERFTLSFFDEGHRDKLEFCGTHSGRDVDKAARTGLMPFPPTDDTVAFRQARLIMVCKKIYTHDLDPDNFLEPDIEDCYPEKGYHRMYVGRLERALRAID
ncbi:flavin reductase family protein [Candidatus Fermentibacteria bacterium]|nr:flavin reductase family protein [Candidatus Fermentibacteria bacterium]